MSPAMSLDPSLVAILTGHEGDPSTAPHSPSVRYPEHPFASVESSDGPDPAYEGVRSV